jgi:hypothetical protein
VIAAIAPEVQARDEWVVFAKHGLKLRYLRGSWLSCGNAGGGKSERVGQLGPIPKWWKHA